MSCLPDYNIWYAWLCQEVITLLFMPGCCRDESLLSVICMLLARLL